MMNKIQKNQKSRRLIKFVFTMGLISLVLAVSLNLTNEVVKAAPLAADAPGLGAAGSFSVLGFSAVTNTGSSTIGGDIGVYSGTSITGLDTIVVGGATHQTDTVAQQAQSDAKTAAGSLSSQTSTKSLGALDSLTLVPGVYDLGAGSLGGGVLTLNGPGVYIFRTSSSLTSAGSVSLINGARACDVYWFVATQANLVSGSFVGTIIAGSGIVFGSGVSLDGRALATGGPVTMISNRIYGPGCAATAAAAATATATTTTTAVTATATTTTTTADASITSATAVATPATILSNTGADLDEEQALVNRQWLRVGLGVFGLGLIGIGFSLRRKQS
jgi:hypothetical protein